MIEKMITEMNTIGSVKIGAHEEDESLKELQRLNMMESSSGYFILNLSQIESCFVL